MIAWDDLEGKTVLALAALHRAQGLLGAYRDNPEEPVDRAVAGELERAIYDTHAALSVVHPEHHVGLLRIDSFPLFPEGGS